MCHTTGGSLQSVLYFLFQNWKQSFCGVYHGDRTDDIQEERDDNGGLQKCCPGVQVIDTYGNKQLSYCLENSVKNESLWDPSLRFLFTVSTWWPVSKIRRDTQPTRSVTVVSLHLRCHVRYDVSWCQTWSGRSRYVESSCLYWKFTNNDKIHLSFFFLA
jgi:hypothetical protein